MYLKIIKTFSKRLGGNTIGKFIFYQNLKYKLSRNNIHIGQFPFAGSSGKKWPAPEQLIDIKTFLVQKKGIEKTKNAIFNHTVFRCLLSK